MASRSVLLCVLLLASCGGASDEVDLTIALGASVDATAQASITTLVVAATGDETYSQSLPLGRPISREESTRYRPKASSRALTLTVSANDVSGHTVATGAVALALHGVSVRAEVTLEPELADLGVDFAPQDLSPSDGAVAPDASVAYLDVFDFEGDAMDKSLLLQPVGTDCAITTAHAHGGTHAEHCTGQSFVALDGPFLGAGQDTIAIRAYLLADAPPGSSVVNLAGFFDTTNLDEVQAGLDDKGNWEAGDYTTESMYYGYAANASAIGDTSWRCIELVLTRPSTLDFYFEGTHIKTQTDVAFPTSFDKLAFGIVRASNPLDGGTVPAVGVYVDDVVVSTQRIGCN